MINCTYLLIKYNYLVEYFGINIGKGKLYIYSSNKDEEMCHFDAIGGRTYPKSE